MMPSDNAFQSMQKRIDTKLAEAYVGTLACCQLQLNPL